MGQIMAVVTLHKEKVGGGAPIFVAENEQDQQQTAFKLEKILDASAHDLQNGTMIIVKHSGGKE
ncbi:hypothetical protein P9314_12070 [Paenibacillus validus]|uniref:Uncharacterized protein n=1 Tax=Paenibacillus validus TaxID=44253 RepID=A0A7X2ZCE8_9BACL|nr:MULTISPECIES: hypothetical protein [Paenibacillus]MED4601439.1 hypothetical protein [Paenibacillus validus]MED4607768.1 hypothetical protein [Paenibacillus validus]MUG71705.1 hypothetical protein [Paenibacillus validus]